MPPNVHQTSTDDRMPLRYSRITLRLRATRAIKKTNGTAAMPLNTAVNTNALIGSIPTKFSPSPISVAPAMTP
jgi:hypothetical protein